MIVATVLSGAGLGLLFWLAFARLFHASTASPQWWQSFVLALLLIAAGALWQAWRAAPFDGPADRALRPGMSWASRRTLLTRLLYPVALLYAWAVWQEVRWAQWVVGALLIALCLGTLICGAMLFASQPRVPRWHTWHTRVGLPLLGLMSGSLVLSAMVPVAAAPVAARISVVLLVLGAALKAAYFLRFADTPSDCAIAPAQRTVLKILMFVLAFGAPFVLMALSARLAPAAAILSLAGLLVERRLFLAEALKAGDSPPVTDQASPDSRAAPAQPGLE